MFCAICGSLFFSFIFFLSSTYLYCHLLAVEFCVVAFNRAVSQIDFGRFSSFVKPRSKASNSLEAVTRRWGVQDQSPFSQIWICAVEWEARARFKVDDVIDVSRYLHLSSNFNPQKVKQMGWKVERKSVIPAVSGVKSRSLRWFEKTRDRRKTTPKIDRQLLF